MHRFFLTSGQIQDNQILFPTDIGHQLRRVLRMQDGDIVQVLDNDGFIYEVIVDLSSGTEVKGLILQKDTADTEPTHLLTLYVGLTQREKFEWVLQKGTELGVSRFVPFISERSLVQKADKAEKKNQRWQSILREAAEQSHRGRIPDLEEPCAFPAAVTQAVSSHDLCMIPWEEEHQSSLGSILTHADAPKTIALAIGPEGGFSVAEVQFAIKQGFKPVTLGKRILRMETAAMAAAAMVLYTVGDME